MDIDRYWNCNGNNQGILNTRRKKVIDVGPIHVNKTENKWIGWPTYAGALLAITGIVLVVTSRKK